jgi:hypothetical protein
MEIVLLLLLSFLVFLKLPFSLFCLPLQFIYLINKGSETFLFSSKMFPKHSLLRCLCSGGACLDTSILQKKVVAASLGGGLALVDAEDLANNISTSNWLLPISNRFCLYSFHSFL